MIKEGENFELREGEAMYFLTEDKTGVVDLE